MSEEKNKLRDVMRQRREKLTADEKRTKSDIICKNTFAIIKPGETVMGFASKPAEVDTMPFLKMLLNAGNPLVVPIIVKEDHSLRLSYLRKLEHLVPSTFNVPEPIGNEIPVPEGAVDVVILPMLAFDKYGSRLGYGSGYYDRFLEKNPNVKTVAMAFACQEAEKVPTEEFDVPVDYVITENGIAYQKK